MYHLRLRGGSAPNPVLAELGGIRVIKNFYFGVGRLPLQTLTGRLRITGQLREVQLGHLHRRPLSLSFFYVRLSCPHALVVKRRCEQRVHSAPLLHHGLLRANRNEAVAATVLPFPPRFVLRRILPLGTAIMFRDATSMVSAKEALISTCCVSLREPYCPAQDMPRPNA